MDDNMFSALLFRQHFTFFGEINQKLKLTMDTSKALDDDGPSSQMPGFQGGMLPAASLTVVLITYNYPRDLISLQQNNENRGNNIKLYKWILPIIIDIRIMHTDSPNLDWCWLPYQAKAYLIISEHLIWQAESLKVTLKLKWSKLKNNGKYFNVCNVCCQMLLDKSDHTITMVHRNQNCNVWRSGVHIHYIHWMHWKYQITDVLQCTSTYWLQ